MSNRCPHCGNQVTLKNGVYGYFFGCTSFPRCRFTCSCDIMPTDTFDSWVYREWLQAEQDRREMDAIIMESRHGDWGCRDED